MLQGLCLVQHGLQVQLRMEAITELT
jgi:hypothetical protein